MTAIGSTSRSSTPGKPPRPSGRPWVRSASTRRTSESSPGRARARASSTTGPAARRNNLISKAEFEDVEIHVEFLVPRASNSGVKFQAVYEVQIFDSFGVKTPKGTDCGAILSLGRNSSRSITTIDGGHPPIVNASKPPWRVADPGYDLPRPPIFPGRDKKIADAEITATLNGQLVQDKLKVDTPTGSAWHDKEKSDRARSCSRETTAPWRFATSRPGSLTRKT